MNLPEGKPLVTGLPGFQELYDQLKSEVRTLPGENSTDTVISNYENLLQQNIAAKTVNAALEGKVPSFSKEEMAYLTKKAVEESPFAEMTVAVPSPTITLKKGKTELNIKNAATILQKMEEKYPTPKPVPLPQPIIEDKLLSSDEEEEDKGMTVDDIDEIINELDEEISQEQHQEQLLQKHPRSPGPDGPHNVVGTEKEVQTMQDRFKKLVNFPTSKVSPQVAQCVAPDESKFAEKKYSGVSIIETGPTVNKNAYEIREQVLVAALDFVKWQTQMELSIKDDAGCIKNMHVPSPDDVFAVASKFYKFVENRR